MQKDSAKAEISLKVVGGLLFLTHLVYVSIYCFIRLRGAPIVQSATQKRFFTRSAELTFFYAKVLH